MIFMLVTKHHLEFLSLKEVCRGWSESTHVKMSHCWKSHALAQIIKHRKLWDEHGFNSTVSMSANTYTLNYCLCLRFHFESMTVTASEINKF